MDKYVTNITCDRQSLYKIPMKNSYRVDLPKIYHLFSQIQVMLWQR